MSKKIMSLVKLLIINLKNMNIYLFSHITLFADRSYSYILAPVIYSLSIKYNNPFANVFLEFDQSCQPLNSMNLKS